MDDKSSQKISRRDALKILTAVAGGAVLANIPSKWTKPELIAGVLPAHAQTSVAHTLAAGSSQVVGFCYATDLVSTVTISPVASGILMKYTINPDPSVTISSPALLTGTVPTDATGAASLTFTAADITAGGNVTVVWEFANTSDGTGSSSQVFEPAGC